MMKKVVLCIIFVLIMCMSVVCADMGGPEIRRYKVTPISIDGAPYYNFSYDSTTQTSSYIEAGILPYGTVVEIYYETDQDGIKYGNFTVKQDDGRYVTHEVNLADMFVAEQSEYFHSEREQDLKVLIHDIDVYNGPAYGFDIIGTIPIGSDIKGYRIAFMNDNGSLHEESMDPWFYVEYNGIKGWICELGSEVGSYVDGKLITKIDLSFSDDEVAIPASTIIDGYYATDMWSRNAYVSYNGNNYIINLYNCGINSNEWGENEFGYKIEYDSAKLYKSASIESEELCTIPKDTVLPVNYIDYDLRWIGWVYTEYNGIEGWVVFFEDNQALEEFLKGENNYLETEEGKAQLVETPKEQEKIEEIQNNNVAEVTEDNEDSIDPKTLGDIFLYIGIAAIIALTACVTILLINKKKED